MARSLQSDTQQPTVRSRVEQAIAQAERISRRKGYPPGGRLIILMARQLLRQYGTDAARWPRR